MTAIEVPHYISTFDLEQARLGQAIQHLKIKLNELPKDDLQKKYLHILENDHFLKAIQIILRNESLNAEWAIKKSVDEMILLFEHQANMYREIGLILINILLKKQVIYL
ncbi:MAG: phosphoenolpyruvate-utilizing N-terminal domain-containing protein [Bacteriovorax sp.]|nr:phosphoenolpyruvate-utilizing N-terminal domain-containing protein [Bacteriovorax sp.]